MKTGINLIPGGGVTSPRGFLAGAVSAGIKIEKGTRLDLGILRSEVPCTAAAVFSRNRVKAAPVVLCQQRLEKGWITALVVNSGYANSCTGKQGMADAVEMTGLTARHIGVAPEEVLVSSTGVIGMNLPMERIRSSIREVVLTANGGHELAQAIMTTDTVPKEVAVNAGDFIIGGMAKGSGMIHPDLATMLCFLTTDAAVDADFLQKSLEEAVAMSFNMLSVDGDNSTNDTVLIMANGKVGGDKIGAGSREAEVFQQALNEACIYLTKEIARDGEGATKLIEVTVAGAASETEARMAARTVVSSLLVKAAVHGSDPNWGRIVAAAGRCGISLMIEKIQVEIGGVRLVDGGGPVSFDREKVVKHLNGPEVAIKLDLNIGNGQAVAWGCDLSEEYVTINSDYTT
jgi:glutamate N-acetyltransferase/amino-acid N-acetyltransferase